MNYLRIYNILIKSRQDQKRTKIPGDGLERHHIVPRSIGGVDESSNLVYLTPKEHFIAHRLLVKIYSGKYKAKMVYALHKMMSSNSQQTRNYITSRHYEAIRQYYHEHCSGENHPNYGKDYHTEETKAAIRERMTGDNNPSRRLGPWNKGMKGQYKQNLSQEVIERKLTTAKNLVRTAEIRKKIGDTHRNKPKSDDHKRKLSDINTGKTLSQETKDKMSRSRKGKIQPDITCPHCGKTGKYSAMYRWHMDRCTSI